MVQLMADIKTQVRFPEDMYEEVKALADKEFRSLNGQILVLISEALEKRRQNTARRDEDGER